MVDRKRLPCVEMGGSAARALIDNIVGASEGRRRDRQAERFSGSQVDDQLVLRRCLHREVARLLALKYPIHVAGRTSVLIPKISPVGNEAAVGDIETVRVNRGQPVPGRECNDQVAIKCSRRARRKIMPPFAERAKAVMPRSMSPALRRLIGLTSKPSDGATD